jgi:hypothetical protein
MSYKTGGRLGTTQSKIGAGIEINNVNMAVSYPSILVGREVMAARMCQRDMKWS